MSLLIGALYPARLPHLRSLIFLGHSHTFSSSAPTRKEKATFGDLTDILEDAANKHPPRAQKKLPPQKSLGERMRGKEFAPVRKTQYSGSRFKPLDGVHWVSPHSWSFKNRTNTPKIVKKFAVGPSSKESKTHDVFHQMDIDPLHECMNSTLMSYFVTELGKIKGRAETKLTWRSQRRMGKAVRRAKMMGIIPFFSRRKLIFPSNWGGVLHEK